MAIQKTILKNGLTVATDNVSNFETVSLGMFVNVGSVNEAISESGISHFIEHMAFKGTKKRTALEISSSIESVGGYMNAYTSKEVTAFHAKVLKNDMPLAVDVVLDIVQNSIFSKEELEKERGVIIQEIRQLNDTPDDLIFDMFQEKCFEGESIGTPILGNESNISSLQSEDLISYMKNNYSTNKMIFCASGNVDHQKLVEIVEENTKDLSSFQTKSPEVQKYKGGHAYKSKDLEQNHVILGFEGFSHKDPNKFDMFVISTILGGGMSSRLFQEIREKRGLAYSIFSFTSNYKDTGTFGVYSGCDIKSTEDCIDIISSEFNSFEDSVNDDEIEKAKTQIKAALLMGLESSSARMERMANQYLLQNEFLTADEISAKIDSISMESVKNTSKIIFSKKPTLVVIGSMDDVKGIYDRIY